MRGVSIIYNSNNEKENIEKSDFNKSNDNVNNTHFNKDNSENNQKNTINNKRNTKIILLIAIISFLIMGFFSFIILGLFSTIMIDEIENIEESQEIEEIISKGQNEGYIFNERHNIDYYSNIHKEERFYNPIKTSDNYIHDKKVRNLKPYLYENQKINPVLIEHGISSYMTEKGTEPLKVDIHNKKNKPVVCVQDWFDDGDNHGEYIAAYIQSLYDGPIYLIDNYSIEFNIFTSLDFYQYCDIVNMSIGYTELLFERNFINSFGETLKNKDTIFIYAAGNDFFSNSEDEQELTHFKNKILDSDKEKYKDIKEAIPNYFISVTQGLVSDDELDKLAYRIYSGGKGVDLIVMNGDVYADYQKLSGTSFAVPVATAMAANLLTAGVPKEEVLDYLKSDYVLTDDQQMTYPILLVDDIQNKVNNLEFK